MPHGGGGLEARSLEWSQLRVREGRRQERAL
jgi:hypothetical protein